MNERRRDVEDQHPVHKLREWVRANGPMVFEDSSPVVRGERTGERRVRVVHGPSLRVLCGALGPAYAVKAGSVLLPPGGGMTPEDELGTELCAALGVAPASARTVYRRRDRSYESGSEVREERRDTTMTTDRTIKTVAVREIIDPAGIGGDDAEWSETVRSATEAALVEYISERWPNAKADVRVTIGRAGESRRSVFVNDGPATSALERDLRNVSERAFEKCCN